MSPASSGRRFSGSLKTSKALTKAKEPVSGRKWRERVLVEIFKVYSFTTEVVEGLLCRNRVKF